MQKPQAASMADQEQAGGHVGGVMRGGKSCRAWSHGVTGSVSKVRLWLLWEDRLQKDKRGSSKTSQEANQ